MNLHAVLGIAPDADEAAIRRAYRILARRYHPDRGADSSTEKFRQIADAYETLSDRHRRREYDLSTRAHREFLSTRAEHMTRRPEPTSQPIGRASLLPRVSLRANSPFEDPYYELNRLMEANLFGRFFGRW